MSSITSYFEKHGSDVASIIVIVFGVVALLILLSPR